jgi:hypothetical protein
MRPSQWEFAVGNLLFFRRSCAYRFAATEMMRHARAMPAGSERRAARRLARALRDMANTEAWLEGQTPHLRSATYGRQLAAGATSAATDRKQRGPVGGFGLS